MRMLKILVVVALALFVMPYDSFAQADEAPPANTSLEPGGSGGGAQTLIKLEFGRPKKDCAGFGICSISFGIGDIIGIIRFIGSLLRSQSVGTGGINDDGNYQVDFALETMDEFTRNHYFPDGTFRVNETYELPSELLEGTGVESYTIQPGVYPVVEAQVQVEETVFDVYRVVFNQ